MVKEAPSYQVGVLNIRLDDNMILEETKDYALAKACYDSLTEKYGSTGEVVCWVRWSDIVFVNSGVPLINYRYEGEANL